MDLLGESMRKFLVAGIAAAAFSGTPALATDIPMRAPVLEGVTMTRVRAENDVAAVARDMYIFTFPLHEFYRVRYATSRRQPINQFWHFRKLLDHTARTVTTPNNDTLYSTAFLDLSHGPQLLEVPEISDRYYSVALMDSYTNNFAYIGTRTTGTAAGKYLIAGPGWKDSPPTGTRIILSPTNSVWLLVRVQVNDASDLPRLHGLQDSFKLSAALETAASLPLEGPPIDPNDPWNYFAVANHALAENPPSQKDNAILSRIAAIHVGPGEHFDPGKLSAADQNQLLAGIEEAKGIIAAKELKSKVVNGWAYPVPGIGNFGSDYLLRAATALKLLAALEVEEATYMFYVGEPLDGSHRYRLHFEPNNLPPVDAFWSFSMYEVLPDKRMFFTDNPIKRYSIGDRTPGLRRNANGSLDIYFQRESPAGDREGNWLPAPTGPFEVVFRAYLPKQGLLDGTYVLPSLERLQ